MSNDLIANFGPIEETGTHVNASTDQLLGAMTGSLYSGATIDVDFPEMTTSVHVLSGIAAEITETFPAIISGDMFSGVTIESTFQEITGTGSVTSGTVMEMEGLFPELEGLGSILSGLIGQISSSFEEMTGEAHSFSGINASLSGSFESLAGDMSGTVNALVQLEGTFPLIIPSMTALVGVKATIACTFPMMTESMSSRTVAFQTYCMNLDKKTLVSKFTNYGFNSYGYINGHMNAGAKTGLYVLEGSTDNGIPIVSSFSSPALTFGSHLLKKLRAAKLGGKLDGRLKITISNGIKSWSTIITASGMLPGYKSGYFSHEARGEFMTFTISNPDGTDFIINDIELYLMFLER